MPTRDLSNSALPCQMLDLACFCIVTPVFNGADYIDETIASVLTQSGDFDILYHVQDGGSSDKTMERVRRWAGLLTSGQFPVLCRKILFTFSSEPDRGMYDAINKAFTQILPAESNVIMGWINADDRVAPGALSTISNIRRQFPEIRFLGGRVSLLDQTGSILGVNLPRTYSQPCMVAGLYDGRALPFVMQEGTFWCSDLWNDVGGALDTRFSLAGDWDLWRRFAKYAPYFSVDSILGFHRRRPGQLSGQMDKYYRELDQRLEYHADLALHSMPGTSSEPVSAVLGYTQAVSIVAARAIPERPSVIRNDGVLRVEYNRVLREFEQLQAEPSKFRSSNYAAPVVRFNINLQTWERLENFGLLVGSPEVISLEGVRRSTRVVPTVGFHPSEGPYPEWNLPAGVRYVRGMEAQGEVHLPQPARYDVVLRCRSWTDGLTVVLTGDDVILGRLKVTAHGNDRESELRVSSGFSAGRLTLGIKVEQPGVPAQRALLVTSWHVEQIPTRNPCAVTPVDSMLAPIGALAGPLTCAFNWPRISIVVPTRNQGRFIADTLQSVLRQGYPNLELIVVDGASTDDTPEILRRYARHITHIISERDSGQSNAINKGFGVASGELLTWLNSDDLLAKGALHAVALAFRTTSADLIAGVCEVFDDSNITIHRHLPCLRDGAALPLEHILDLDNRWMRGQFFHQPEVFFTRAIWERAGGRVDETLYYSMDFDLWARMAHHGARISLIGRTVAHYRVHPAQKTATPEAYKPELLAHAKKLRAQYGFGPMPGPKSAPRRLRVVAFNDYGFKYGAGIAHRRLTQSLALAGQEVVALAYADFDFGTPVPALSADAVAEEIIGEKPDLVILGNLHAIGADFDLLGALLRRDVAVVFYAHDQWLVTGRCGYSSDCTRYLARCDAECPTTSKYPSLLPEEVAPAFIRKREVLARARFDGRRFAVFTNSRYMRAHILNALPETQRPAVHIVPFGIDTRLFTHGNRAEARILLDLPNDRFIIVTAAVDVADPRKGMPLLLQSLLRLPNPEQVLLLVMGLRIDSNLPDSPCEIRFTGYLDREDIIALHYQAADIFVGPSLHEAFGQTYIEAGACGIPTVAFKVGGVVDAVLDGITGILMEETTADAIVEGIQRLRLDTALRRQMGTQAVLFVRNRFSLEASAAQILAALTEERSLGLEFAPNVVLSTRTSTPLTLRYLLGRSAGQAKTTEPSNWFPLANIISEMEPESSGVLRKRFWWASGPVSRLALRVPAAGNYRVRLRCRCHLTAQKLSISANRGAAQELALPTRQFDIAQDLEFALDLLSGLNRLDIAFAVSEREPGGSRDLALLLEDIEVTSTALDLASAPDDGAVEWLDGFSYREGPYPELGLPAEFRWAVAGRGRMMVFSRRSARRVMELRVRNMHLKQTFAVHIGDREVLRQSVTEAALTTLVRLRFEANFGVGFHSVQIDTSVRSKADTAGRELAFVLEGVCFDDVGALEPATEVDRIRWDLTEGIGAEEGPYPDHGVPSRFRWIISRRPRIVVSRGASGRVVLVMHYRAPMQGQGALLSINSEEAISLDLDRTSFADSGVARCLVQLHAGQNVLEFTFHQATQPPGEVRELVLLLERLEVEEEICELLGVASPDNPAVKLTVGSTNLTALHVTQPEDKPVASKYDGSWRPESGFRNLEGPYPAQRLPSPFRWCVGERATFDIYSGELGIRKLSLSLRNFHPEQEVTLEANDGRALGTFRLRAWSLHRLDIQTLDVSLHAGWNRFALVSKVWSKKEAIYEQLSIILEDVKLGITLAVN